VENRAFIHAPRSARAYLILALGILCISLSAILVKWAAVPGPASAFYIDENLSRQRHFAGERGAAVGGPGRLTVLPGTLGKPVLAGTGTGLSGHRPGVQRRS